MSSNNANPTGASQTSSSASFSIDSAHWEGLPTFPPTGSQTPGGGDGSNTSFLSNTGAVVGLCVGIGVVTLLFAGFLVYRVRLRKRALATELPDPFNQLDQSTKTGPIQLPPSPNPAHTLSPEAHSRYTSTRSASSRVTNPFTSSQRTESPASHVQTSDRPTGRSPAPFTPHHSPRNHNEFEMQSTSSVLSNQPSKSELSSSHYLLPSTSASPSQPAQPKLAQRVISVPPPYSPPAYAAFPGLGALRHSRDSTQSTVLGSSEQAHKMQTLGVSGSDTDRRASQLSTYSVPEYPYRFSLPPHQSDAELAENSSQGHYMPVEVQKATLVRATSFTAPKPGTKVTIPTAERDTPGALPESPEHLSATNTMLDRPTSDVTPTSAIDDPFSNSRYELASWISSDPYSTARVRQTANSIYAAMPKSAAASSRVLPSDTSLRSLTPEPDDYEQGSSVQHASVLRSASLVSTTGRPRFKLDHFEPESVLSRAVLNGPSAAGSSRPVIPTSTSGAGSGRQGPRGGPFISSSPLPPIAQEREPERERNITSPVPFHPDDMPWLGEDPYMMDEQDRRRGSIGSSKLLHSEAGHGNGLDSPRNMSPEPEDWFRNSMDSRRESIDALATRVAAGKKPEDQPRARATLAPNPGASEADRISTVDVGEDGLLWAAFEAQSADGQRPP